MKYTMPRTEKRVTQRVNRKCSDEQSRRQKSIYEDPMAVQLAEACN